MHKIITQIRDLELIEKELQSSIAGVLALNLTSEKLVQLVTPYVYKDKNIFVFFNDDSEIIPAVHFDSPVSFTVLRYGKARKTKSMDYEPSYNIFSISIHGIVRKVDDLKLIDDVRQNYIRKYKKSAQDKVDLLALNNLIIVDSEEIQALEETGG